VNETENQIGLRFMLLGMTALLGGLLFGAIGAIQFLNPDFLPQVPFFKTRPLHVSTVVSWIFLAAIGGIYYYLPNHRGLRLFSPGMARLHFWLFLVTGTVILACYFGGQFGGREYWAFPAVLALPIFASWILFGFNYFKTVAAEHEPWPVYYWMWGTGIIFFFLTFSEAYLWLIPYFRENMIREITVQWKAYGALVGSWNMMCYGTAIFIMEKISGDRNIARSGMAFSLFFVGLTALLFGWAHHTYPVPSASWIRGTAFIVSMLELVILGKIIWDWRQPLSDYQKYRHRCAYLFIFASDAWIFLNLILALLISVPAFNILTHGTHITVAHAMGSTIGINTMILLASVFFIIEERMGETLPERISTIVRAGYWVTNACLLVFFGALVGAGLGKGTFEGGSFQQMMIAIQPYLKVFALSGAGIVVGLWLVLLPAIHLMYGLLSGKRQQLEATLISQ